MQEAGEGPALSQRQLYSSDAPCPWSALWHTPASGHLNSNTARSGSQVHPAFGGAGAASVAPAGGYFQGAGHTAMSPLLGLAADNTLRKRIESL